MDDRIDRIERPDPASNPPLNPPDVDLDDMGMELAGERALDDQGPVVQEEFVSTTHGLQGDTPIYEGDLEAEGATADAERIESLTDLELREGETDDPNVAAEEGLTYVPPTDPPVYPGPDEEGADIAAGFGSTSTDEPFDESHHDELLYAEDEMTARVRDALRADAATSLYADSVRIDTEGGVVVLRGVVDDINDTDALASVAEQVEGVTEVRDELRVRGL